MTEIFLVRWFYGMKMQLLLLGVSFSLDWDEWDLDKLPQPYISSHFSDWNNNFATLIKSCKFDSEAIKVKDETTCANFRVLWEVSYVLIDFTSIGITRWGCEWCSAVLGKLFAAIPEAQVSSHWCPGMDLWRSPCDYIMTTFPDHSLSKRLLFPGRCHVNKVILKDK